LNLAETIIDLLKSSSSGCCDRLSVPKVRFPVDTLNFEVYALRACRFSCIALASAGPAYLTLTAISEKTIQ
jgi:hypothetical protein